MVKGNHVVLLNNRHFFVISFLFTEVMASMAKVFTSSVVMGLSSISFSLFQASSSYVLQNISRISSRI